MSYLAVLTALCKQAATAGQKLPLAPKGTEADAMGMNASPTAPAFVQAMQKKAPAAPAPVMKAKIPAPGPVIPPVTSPNPNSPMGKTSNHHMGALQQGAIGAGIGLGVGGIVGLLEHLSSKASKRTSLKAK